MNLAGERAPKDASPGGFVYKRFLKLAKALLISPRETEQGADFANLWVDCQMDGRAGEGDLC